MKIVSIFAERLFAFHYDNEEENEYDRLMTLWSDVDHLRSYAKKNNLPDIYGFVKGILDDTEEIQDLLERINLGNPSLCLYFEPIQELEARKMLSLQKGKIRNNKLRLYALKIDCDCYVITGGAIKMSQKMQDHPDTTKELDKLKAARAFLCQNDVFDGDSFFELIIEGI